MRQPVLTLSAGGFGREADDPYVNTAMATAFCRPPGAVDIDPEAPGDHRGRHSGRAPVTGLDGAVQQQVRPGILTTAHGAGRVEFGLRTQL